MSCHSPEELFGEAVGDPKALRRAYAALTKDFRPDDDPEAFQRLRSLYERARDGLEAAAGSAHGPPPSPDERAAEHPTPAEAKSVGSTLRAAMAAGDHRQTLEILHLWSRTLLDDEPALAEAATWSVLRDPRWMSPEDQDVAARLTEDTRWPDDVAQSFRDQVAWIEDVQALVDAGAPPELLEVAWSLAHPDLPKSAAAMGQTAQRLDVEALSRWVDVIERRCPELRARLEWTVLQIDAVGAQGRHPGLDEARWRRLLDDHPNVPDDVYWLRKVSGAIAAALLLAMVVLPWIQDGRPDWARWMVASTAALFLCSIGDLTINSVAKARHQAAVEPKPAPFAEVRALGLFPSEVPSVQPTSERGSRWLVYGHPLNRLRQERLAVWLLLGDIQLARLRGAVAEGPGHQEESR